MTDESTPQTQQQAKKDEKKVPPGGNNRGGGNRRSVSTSKPGGGGGAGGPTPNQAPRPSSRASNGNKRTTSSNQPESGSESAGKKTNDAPRQRDQRGNRPQSGPGRNPSHRKGSASQGPRNNNPNNNNNNQQGSGKRVPSASQGTESSDALSSLQSLIADLKTGPAQQQAGGPASMQAPPQAINVPGFQAAFSGSVADPKHRKAASLGAGGMAGNFGSYSPNLGAMLEGIDESEQVASFEDGEIPEQHQPQFQRQGGHQPRAQSQSFLPPRLAALAAQQQEQSESMGFNNRPQLAPGFTFGARMRNATPAGPPISEEDVGFQFPQQQQLQQGNYGPDPNSDTGARKPEPGVTGIMAEQVSYRATSHYNPLLT
jgi:protein SSD1